MKKKLILFAVISFSIIIYGQTSSPGEKLTSYGELFNSLKESENRNELIEFDTLAISFEKRAIPFLKISKNDFNDSSKVKVLVFAQQHGNEQSGKEAALLLTEKIISGEFNYLFDKIDLILVPQMNPDGSEKDERRNGAGIDLNRNHLLLTAPETRGLHNIFNEYLPEVTLDVHEYGPFSESWMNEGYIKNFDEQLGTSTNPNIDDGLIALAKNDAIPFVDSAVTNNGFSFNEYILGGPPGKERMRFSTVDINDGRNSFGVYNTLSFILEGKNGKNSSDNINHRKTGQYIAIKGLLDFVFSNAEKIKEEVNSSRKSLIDSNTTEKAIIRMEHIKGSKSVDSLTYLSLKSGRDTTVYLPEFHDSVKTILSVKIPKAYLIHESDSNLVNFLKNHNIQYENYETSPDDEIYQYIILDREKSVDEELENYFVNVERFKISPGNIDQKYLLIPMNQPASKMLIQAFEPQSMLGLIQYDEYEYLLSESYPILRLE